MIVGGQTEARAQLSSTIIDYHAPFDQGLSKAIAMAICPIIVHFRTYRARSMHDVACEFACAVRMRSSNGRERP